MQADGEMDRVLARQPDGTLVLSTLLTDRMPLGHVYRVVGPSGTVLREFSTLAELTGSLSGPPTPPTAAPTGAGPVGPETGHDPRTGENTP